jgi:hypothetical protein
MKNWILNNTLYLVTALGVLVFAYTAFQWPSMPVLQRFGALFFLGLILQLWEEGRYPGGFTDLVASKLRFTQNNPHFGEMATVGIVLSLTFVPLFFPNVPFLVVAALRVGFLEALAHIAAAAIMLRRPYSPGTATALLVLLPISVLGIAYVIRHDLMTPRSWVFAFLYMLSSLMLAQQAVVRASGMKYAEFLRNVRGALFGKR